ncbi:hypothetical protein [Chlorobium phaeobacteroides]|nr:hypothetical protein [Chlorobium phaeobacteroides]
MNNPSEGVMKSVIGIAGATMLFSPVGIPIVQGLAGLAVVGLGFFAAGSILGQFADKAQHKEKPDSIEDNLPFP